MERIFFTDTVKCSECGFKGVGAFRLRHDKYICTNCLTEKKK